MKQYDSNWQSGGVHIIVKELTEIQNHSKTKQSRNQIMSHYERERKIVYLRYFEGKTQTEISEEVGISQAQVSRLEKNALKEIKHTIRA